MTLYLIIFFCFIYYYIRKKKSDMLEKKFMDAIIHNRKEEVEYFINHTDVNITINRQDPLKKRHSMDIQISLNF